MHFRTTPVLFCAFVLIGTGLLAPHHAAAQRYRVVPIETIPDHLNHFLRGLNDAGQVFGYAIGPSGPGSRPYPSFLWTEGQGLEVLPYLDPNEPVTIARDLNNRMEAVGDSMLIIGGKGVLWRKVNNEWTVTDIAPDLPDTSADTLNDDALIVGKHWVEFLRFNSILWENGQWRYIESANYASVNNRGQLSGWLSGNAVVWENGMQRTLPHLWPGGYSSGRRMNDRGDVVGFARTATDNSTAVAWFVDGPRRVTHLGRLHAIRGGTAIDINDDRIVVGNNHITSAHVGFVWRNHVMHNLNDLLLDGASADWHIIRAWRINRWGQIGSDAYNRPRHQNQPVRLDPVDEGLTVWSFLPNEPGMVNTLEVIHATPGGRVVLVAGTERGEARDVPQCPGATIELENPRLIATAVADADGRARFNIPLPQHFAGRRAVVHAIDWSTCTVSPPGFIQFQE